MLQDGDLDLLTFLYHRHNDETSLQSIEVQEPFIQIGVAHGFVFEKVGFEMY